MEKVYTVKTFDTLKKKHVSVEVSKEVYEAYMRSEWNMAKASKSFYKHEIQFSGLVGGDEGSFENFREFIDFENTPEKFSEKEMIKVKVQLLFNELTEDERNLVKSIIFQGMTQQQYATLQGISQPMVNKRLKNILKKLLEKWL